MSNDAINAVIVEHALDVHQRENLAIACGIQRNFAEIQKRVILKFLATLRGSLTGQLGDTWVMKEEIREHPLDGDLPIFSLGRKTWSLERPPVGLGSNCRGEGVYIGLWKERLPGLTEKDENRLREKLRSKGDRIAGPRDPWTAWYDIKGRYKDWSWNNPDGLGDMYFSPERVAEDFQERILWWATVVSSVIESRDAH
jgi:hypothetical protein